MYSACRNGDLRLQGSAIKGRGRVEVCVHNVWGTICDNSWNSNDARVVCNQLGFSRFGKLHYVSINSLPHSLFSVHVTLKQGLAFTVVQEMVQEVVQYT